MRRFLWALGLALPTSAFAADTSYDLQLVIGGSTAAPAGVDLPEGAIASTAGAAPGADTAEPCGLVKTGGLLQADAACQALLARDSTELPTLFLPDTAGAVHPLAPPALAWSNAAVLTYSQADSKSPLEVAGLLTVDPGTWPCRKAGDSWKACTVATTDGESSVTLPEDFGPLGKAALQLAGPAGASGHSVTFLTEGGASGAGADTGEEDPCAVRESHRHSDKEKEVAKDAPQVFYVCLNAAGALDMAPSESIRDLVLKPNRVLTVELYYPQDTPLVVTTSGTVGLSAGTTDQGSGAAPTGGGSGDAAVVRHTQVLGPFVAGTNVTVSVHVQGDETRKASQVLVVDQLYRGAIRFGISGVMGSAVDRTYSAQTYPGSATPEISVTDGGNLDVEFVVAYAAFLDKDGRGTISACYPLCFAPYVGLGILSVGTDTGSGADRFKALKSVYLGAEWEPIKNFSISLTAVPRRVSRLQDGLEVGGALNQGATTVPVRTGFVVGGGVVISLSSDYFRTVSKSSNDILSGS